MHVTKHREPKSTLYTQVFTMNSQTPYNITTSIRNASYNPAQTPPFQGQNPRSEVNPSNQFDIINGNTFSQPKSIVKEKDFVEFLLNGDSNE
ncbi:18143_t:CDS:2 [Acaulospora morrowiae]|uniref:18143_t:CDS:1 n=1 Tax=Acaulospora morrowiae TaxID=94023 RepID=A0A9N8WV02_9GLOM|nr:18143_t:CDS:2 [Acaulospora morrowiae]